jgi:hypothetical protein
MDERILILVILFLLILSAFILGLVFRKKRPKVAVKPEKKRLFQVCPLCGTELKRGERIHSVVYPGQNYKLIHIFGCPYCYGKSPVKKTRKCPSCKRVMPEEAYLAGKMWADRGITRVRVSGCTLCLPLSADTPAQKSV